MNKQSILLFLAATLVFVGCNDAGNDPEPPQISSVYITNEGNFSDANGSVTSFDPQTESTIQQVFQNANGRPLAGIIQSTSIIDDRMYIVLNSADKIEVVDAESFTSTGTIELSNTPVSIVQAADNQAYVSNLYANNVSVIDLESLEETGTTIPVGMNPQAMVRVGSRVFVANNGFGNDNTVSVIDVESESVTNTITVGNGPADLVVDQSDRIWVVCNGLIAYDEDFNRDPENDIPGSIYLIDGTTATIAGQIETGGHPTGLALNEQTGRGFLLNDGVQIVNMNSLQIEAEPFSERHFNAIANSANEDLIYVGQSKGFTQPGQAIRYDLNGVAVDSFTVGIAPRGFNFLRN
ncbi:MAG: hypothetical protein JXR26_03960 [Balneolaceae bacterium]|nr:hypothetical protein [Balneolaceae bacterium]